MTRRAVCTVNRSRLAIKSAVNKLFRAANSTRKHVEFLVWSEYKEEKENTRVVPEVKFSYFLQVEDNVYRFVIHH